MKFVGTGLSHKTAPIELRERLAQRLVDLDQALIQLSKQPGLAEICIVSTCNRVEFYASGSAEPAALGREIKSFIEEASGVRVSELESHLYQYEGADGIRHLFRVAASLDSMVLGEPQILGQVKQAYRTASGVQAVGPTLSRIFQRAFAVAKRIRSETDIGAGARSMSFAAVELGKEIFTSLEGKSVLLIGAGKMSTLAAKHLRNHGGVAEIRVVNRSLERAQELAREVGGEASTLADLDLLLQKADIVISSTAASGYVVDKKLMNRVVRNRRYRPILFIDLAVPRDIDPTIADLDNVFVYDVDDLEEVMAEHRESRKIEAAAAEGIIDAELTAFLRWNASQQVVPVIRALREQSLRIADEEAERTLSNLKANDVKIEQSVRKMGQAIVNKLLHPVLNQLKAQGSHGDPGETVRLLETLFSLEIARQEGTADETQDPGPDQTLDEKPSSEISDNVLPLSRDRSGGAGG